MTGSLGNIEVEGKQNSLFPKEPVIKCFVVPPNSKVEKTAKKSFALRPWQTRTHCCRHKCFPARAAFVADTKNFSDFVQKHFVSATNVSQFAQPKKHHGQQCVLVYQGL